MLTTKFLLLLGPSGVGKSHLMRALQELDSRYTYISPCTNRRLRDGETDKVHVSDSVMDRMAEAGEFLVINEKFGYRYATPRQPIGDAFAAHRFPLLDWPISRIDIMQQAFAGRLYVTYVLPPSLEVLAERLRSDARDPDGLRYREAVSEIERQQAGDYDALYDLAVVNHDNEAPAVAATIHTAYFINALR